ncbi:MAG: DUF6807 family protein [Verrucomicrobiales bacterium]
MRSRLWLRKLAGLTGRTIRSVTGPSSPRSVHGGGYRAGDPSILRPGRWGWPGGDGKTTSDHSRGSSRATLSSYFGGGIITNSEGTVGEPAIFGKPARWMDYSGPVAVGMGPSRHAVTEGITYFDHPSNPRHPVNWHVREDGWMGAAFCLNEGHTIEPGQSLTLRYLLHTHAGAYEAAKAEAVFKAFGERPGFRIRKPEKDEKHRQYEVERLLSP